MDDILTKLEDIPRSKIELDRNSCYSNSTSIASSVHPPTRILSTEEIEAWRDPGYFISIAFGAPKKVQAWACPACEFIKRPARLRTGGNGGDIPRYLIASLPDDRCLIAIAGTDLKKTSSIGCSLDLRLASVAPSDLPGSEGKNMLIHRGFRDCFRRMRNPLKLKVVQAVENGAKHIVLAGYSLGAAMAFLCGVWLRSILASHVSIEIKGYGTPRIGNAVWADYVDSMHGIEAWRIVNYKDVVCRIPPKSMGYRHPRNEIFISKDGARYQVCREQDCKDCSGQFDSGRGWLKVLHRLRKYKELEHFGPYAGVMLHPDLVCTSSGSLLPDLSPTSSIDPSEPSSVPVGRSSRQSYAANTAVL